MPDGLLRRFGHRLGRLRRRHGWTQRQLARRLGAPSSTLSRYENGAQEPGMTMLVRLARALGIDLNQLVLGREPGPEPANPEGPEDSRPD